MKILFESRLKSLLIAALMFAASEAIAAERPAPRTASSTDSSKLTREQFASLHAMLKPQPGESRWMEIDWYPSVWEARQKAAAEGKPIFLMAGSGGAPAAGC